jgi:hypothetical protein
MKGRTWEIYDPLPSTGGYCEIHKQGAADKLVTVKTKALILFSKPEGSQLSAYLGHFYITLNTIR